MLDTVFVFLDGIMTDELHARITNIESGLSNLLIDHTVVKTELRQLRNEHEGLAACKINEIREIKKSQQEMKDDINDKLNLIIIQTAESKGFISGIMKASALVSVGVAVIWQIIINWGHFFK